MELINQYAKASIPLMRTGWTNISTWDINFYFNKKKRDKFLSVLNNFSPSTDDSTPSPPFEKCFSLNSYSSLEVVNHTLWPLLLRWASRHSPWKIWHRAKTMLTRILSLCFNIDVRKENLSLSYRVALLKWLKIWVICSLSSLPTRCIKKSMCNRRK